MAEIVGDTADQCIPVCPQLDAVGAALVLQDVFNACFSVVYACNHRVPFSQNGVWRLLGIGF